MSLLAGPFLKFCGGTSTEWSVSLLLVTDSSQTPEVRLTLDGRALASPAMTLIYSFQKAHFWKCCVVVARVQQRQVVGYRVAGVAQPTGWSWVIPSADTIPMLAYASCAGFHSARDAQKYGGARNERWQHLLARHRQLLSQEPGTDAEEPPYHLLLMGGDQVYADSIWVDRREASAIVDWNDAGQKKTTKFGSLMQNQVERFYLNLYLRRWTEAGPDQVYASIPSLMMWDDHDIFDGWGSFPPEKHNCPVYQGIFRIAAQYFRLFQHHSADLSAVPGLLKIPGPGEQYHSVGFDLGPIAILAPDLRGSRTESQILGRDQLSAVLDWVDQTAKRAIPPKHLLIMLSLPLMYPGFSWLESGLRLLPGAQDLEDDVRDHWTSAPHREERLRLIHRLLNFSARSGCQVTILSGDVHVGATSTIRRSGLSGQPEAALTQLISSAIVNAPPPASALFFLNNVVNRQEAIDDGIVGEMRPFSNTSSMFIARRNWLSLEPDDRDRIWAKLFIENDAYPLIRVIASPAN
ncbi:MAG: hypothetical protein WCK86_01830 [Planctomycetia bacterium]